MRLRPEAQGEEMRSPGGGDAGTQVDEARARTGWDLRREEGEVGGLFRRLGGGCPETGPGKRGRCGKQLRPV